MTLEMAIRVTYIWACIMQSRLIIYSLVNEQSLISHDAVGACAFDTHPRGNELMTNWTTAMEPQCDTLLTHFWHASHWRQIFMTNWTTGQEPQFDTLLTHIWHTFRTFLTQFGHTFDTHLTHFWHTSQCPHIQWNHCNRGTVYIRKNPKVSRLSNQIVWVVHFVRSAKKMP